MEADSRPPGEPGGRLTAQRRRATSYDVARAAGVAQSTVSRCFDPDSGISAATRERVLGVAEQLGYTPNALARSLIQSRSNMVGLMVSELTLRANPALVAGLGRALAAAGKRVMLLACANAAEAEEAARSALEYPLDGLIVSLTLTDAQLARFGTRQVPVVTLNRPAGPAMTDRVASDHVQAGREVAERLHAAGHRRFLCVAGGAAYPVNEERRAGFLGRLAELGVWDAGEVAAAESYGGGRAALGSHIARHGVPDAVFCVYDTLAFGVLDACRFDLGLRVPHDVSVIGFDDLPGAAHQAYDLTSVRQDIAGMAAATVRLLERRLAEPDAPGEAVLVPTALIRRGSARLDAVRR